VCVFFNFFHRPPLMDSTTALVTGASSCFNGCVRSRVRSFGGMRHKAWSRARDARPRASCHLAAPSRSTATLNCSVVLVPSLGLEQGLPSFKTKGTSTSRSSGVLTRPRASTVAPPSSSRPGLVPRATSLLHLDLPVKNRGDGLFFS
jgi:hypothetical protein